MTRTLLGALAAAAALIVGLGGARLVQANILPPAGAPLYAPPAADELNSLARRVGLPGELRYVDASSFDDVRIQFKSGKLPTDLTAYAIPGQFTRFLWQPPDQDRTLFWYVFADRPRPAALDLNLLTGEAVGHLTPADFGNRQGLLVLLQTQAYFDLTGDVAQQNVLGARAFVPWDAARLRFAFDSPVIFPFATRLYDHPRFEVAPKTGKVTEMGPLRVQLTDRFVRAIELQTDTHSATQEATLTYPNLWVPAGATFQAWVALHPRLFDRPDVGPIHLQVVASTPERQRIVGLQVLDPMDRGRQVYSLFTADLSAFGGETIDLTIRAWATDATPPEALDVLIGEPLLRMP